MVGVRASYLGFAGSLLTETDGYAYYPNGSKYSGAGGVSYGASWTNGDVIGIALDLDNGTIAFYKNNVSQGTAFTGISGTYTPGVSNGGVTSSSTFDINFGQRPFTYTPPTGFKKLNTFNLPDSTIKDGSDYFNAVLYTGNGGAQAITGVGFTPSFIWAKSRSNAYDHLLVDAVRGGGFGLKSNTTGSELASGWVSSFDSDGFTYNVGGATPANTNGATYVAWNWKANGSGVTNTDGTITSTVSVNTTAGFSIVGFTAPSGTGNFSVGHGLGVTPAMVIVKTRDSSSAPWYTWSNTFSNLTDDYMRLNATSAKQTQSSGWGAGMTSSVIGLRAGYTTVATEDHIAYVFAPVEGYSAFGSYTGNTSTDGPFIYTGFRPAWVMIKSASSAGDSWFILDSKRTTANVMGDYFRAESSNAEGTFTFLDLLSNGFKLRTTSGAVNDATTFIYMAFAENPFKNALAR
jgi:hypothetical protein